MANPRMLSSNNPYSSRANPVSYPGNPSPFTDMQATNPQRPTSSSKSVQLRRLDGTPYEVNTKPKKIEVAKDMYDGQNPPKYKRQNSAPYVAQSQSARPPSTTTALLTALSAPEHSASCGTCARPRPVAGNVGQAHVPHRECNKCGKRKTTDAPRDQSILMSGQPRPVSAGPILTTPAPAPARQEGRPNTSIDGPRRTCHKCGKSKRPVTAAAPTMTIETPSHGRESASVPSRHIASQHIMYNGIRPATLQISCDISQDKSMPEQNRPSSVASIDIDVIPPTATSEHPRPNILSEDNVEGSPLLNSSAGPKRYEPRRSTSISSISSTISRTFSKHRKQSTESLGVDDGDLGAGRLINIITNAIRGNESQDYERIHAQDRHERRPSSPFSFVGTAAGDDAFELGDMGKPRSGYDSPWEKVEEPRVLMDAFEQKRPDHATIPVERPNADSNYQDDVFLGSPGQRPGITRFKSLRDGVSRASSVARSTSLKRLNSLKNAPQYWYRTDMAIEGVEGVSAGAY